MRRMRRGIGKCRVWRPFCRMREGRRGGLRSRCVGWIRVAGWNMLGGWKVLLLKDPDLKIFPFGTLSPVRFVKVGFLYRSFQRRDLAYGFRLSSLQMNHLACCSQSDSLVDACLKADGIHCNLGFHRKRNFLLETLFRLTCIDVSFSSVNIL